MNKDYRGDLSATEAWTRLKDEANSFLVDVRTKPEWTFVGIPSLHEAGKQPILAEWQVYPTMGVDPQFPEKIAKSIEQAGGDSNSPIFFLCRSGARSASAAAAMTGHGFDQCFNIEGGFEGPPDENGHRGRKLGWKADGLPWQQG